MSRGPVINGAHFSHASVTINVNGRDYFGVSAINYGSERETSPVHGTGPEQVGVVFGVVKHSSDMELYKKDAARLRRALGNGYSETLLTITVTYRETAISELHTDVISCYLKKEDLKSQQGSDPTKETFEFHTNSITRDGLSIAASE